MASKCWAYFWWIFLGWFGVHHIYLKRYRHAFVTLWTFGGGFGVGWLMDAFCLGRYVQLANDIERKVTKSKEEESDMQTINQEDKNGVIRPFRIESATIKRRDTTEMYVKHTTEWEVVENSDDDDVHGAEPQRQERREIDKDYVTRDEVKKMCGIRNDWAPFSYRRVTAELCFSIYFGYIAAACVPSEYSHITILIIPLTALAVATGVHMVANIGIEEVTFKNCLKGMIFPLGFNIITSFLKTGTIQMEVEGILAALGISATVSANRLRGIKKLKKRPRRGCCSRVPDLTIFILASTVVMLVMGVGLYYNAEVTNKDGEKIPLREALRNIMDSPAWIELKATLNALWYRLINGGFWEFVNQLTTDLDLDGEEKAYKVLNLTSDATEKDIQKRYREYAVKYHPDKIKVESEEERKEAENRFMEINKAYERLSSLRQRRNRKNQKVEL